MATISTPAIEEQIIKILTHLEPELWLLFGKIFLVVLMILILKSLMDNLVSYIMFRLNKYLGIGVRVKVNGCYGVVKDVDLRFIHVICDEGHRLLIPITQWKTYHWLICFRQELHDDDDHHIHRTI